MELSEKETKSIIALSEKYPEVAKLHAEFKLYKVDSTRILHKEFNEIAIKLAKELAFVRSGKLKECTILNSEDKLYERILALLTNSEKIFKGMRVGKEDISPDEAARERAKDKETKDETVPM